MSLSSVLNTAAGGLRAQARAADVVSGNVANALTPGFVRRDLLLEADALGAGVKVSGVARTFDPVITAERRLAQADAAKADTLSAGLQSIESAIGDPTETGSLSQLVAQFSASLIEAESRPDSDLRLQLAVDAAGALTRKLNAVGTAIQETRTRADTEIAALVDRVNTAVAQVAELNAQIVKLDAESRQSTPLQEARQQIIDGIADIIPIREVARANGTVSLYTGDGATLLDGTPQRIDFTPVGAVQPWMSFEGGALSGLTLSGLPLEVDGSRSLLGDGQLRAQFDLRDNVGPEAQIAIDAISRDLIERFQDPALDPTLAAGPPPDPGLFTDGGGAFDATVPFAEEGLAQRLALNPAVDRNAGGEVWRLRDGMGAAGPGDPGNAALISALSDRLSQARAPASGPEAGTPRAFGGLTANFLSSVAVARQAADADAAFHTTQTEAYRQAEAAFGVDMDDELQKLLLVEQAYAANARVIQTVDVLLEQMLRL